MREPAGVRTPLGPGPVIERASGEDLLQMAWDVGPVPWQVGALLIMNVRQGVEESAVAEVVGERLSAVPRLRQRLVRPPFGCGRSIWVDDPAFEIRRHVRLRVCASPGDERALLDAACAIVTDPLPASRPLWSATLVTGLAGSRAALVVVFHHVLADGIGGLAILAGLADGVPYPAPGPFPRARPSRRALAMDALRSRSEALGNARGFLRTLGRSWIELNPAAAVTARAASTSLNRPTGARRRLAVARARLDRVRAVAHAHGATVNDVALTAIAGALRSLMIRRGEPTDGLVASIPVSARTTTDIADLGNQVGVMPVALPLCGDQFDRLERIAELTRGQKTVERGASGAPLAAVFRALAALGVLRWFVNRQRVVNTFVTNLRGPGHRLALDGCDITDVLPLTSIVGNVTVSFAVMSYAGELSIMIVTDPERNPDLDLLTGLLQQELDHLTSDAASSGHDAVG
jgi:diacylglycerol O-acyltransferase